MTITYSCVLVGVEVCLIEIETVVGSGFSGLNILGLPTDATRDMRERVRSALESVGIPIPARRVVVNVGPPEIIKLTRTALHQLDFAVAACIVRALYEDKEEEVLYKPTREFLAGELSLAGELKPIADALIYEAISLTHASGGVICLPYYGKESSTPFEYFKNLKDWIENRKNPACSPHAIKQAVTQSPVENDAVSFEREKHTQAKNTIDLLIKNPHLCVAILVAAAGKHNILIAGEPGVGKSFSIKQLPALLRPLTHKEKIEVKLIHGGPHIDEQPFRSPHHSTTSAALVGGASLKPGEVTLAHHGVLFLDELAEFPRASLEALREPLDSGSVTLSRASGTIIYPAQFQLCATANPCACGYLFSRKRPCRCNPTESRKYLQKISGPLLDRFCLQVWASPLSQKEELDIFSQELINIVQGGKVKEFLVHFFEVQTQITNKKNKGQLTEIDCDFSLRGKEKLFQIAFTLENLFPHLKGHSQFVRDILSFRSLVALFNKRIF